MGSGKTLVAAIFLEFGAHIIDADAIRRKLVEPGQPALKEISEIMVFCTKSRNLSRFMV